MPVPKYFLIEVPDGSITAQKLAASAVIETKIADLAISTAKYQDKSVTAEKLADGIIGEASISDNSITTTKIVDGAITEDKLSDDSVSTDKLEDGAVTPSKVSADLKDELWWSAVPGLTQGGGKDIAFRFVNPWAVSVVLKKIMVVASVHATVGTHTLAALKTSGSLNMLSASTYNLAGLTNNTPATVTLNATTGNKTLTPGQDAVFTVSSSDAGLDAEGVFFYALWELQDS